MNRHPHKDAMLDKLVQVLENLEDQFDAYSDPAEGNVLGDEIRALKDRVEAIQANEEKAFKRKH